MRRISKEECIYYVRGYGPMGEYILANECNKKKFLDIVTFLQEEMIFEVYGYCVMDNHVHLIMNIKKNSLSEIMDEIINRFAIYYRELNKIPCQALDEKYYEKLIRSQEQLLCCCRYLHQEPVKYGMVLNMEHYWWSSYRIYHKREKGNMVKSDRVLSLLDGNRKEAVRKFLEYHREFVSEDVV